jgi:NADPH:quinone reductase-like Zn-dependent oxidoreductase
VVSGATGGVGALSVSILKKLGYRVAAITGKETARDYLMNLGAETIIMREDFESMDNKPLLKPAFLVCRYCRWRYSGEYNKIN